MRVFISGPITGTNDYYQRFHAAARRIEWDLHLKAVNPIDCTGGLPDGLAHDEYMVVTMALLKICDVIYMLKGWDQSEGAREEYQYAKEHGYRIMYEV